MLGEGPSRGAVTADGTRGFFTAAKAGMLAVVDLQSGRHVATVSTGPDPHGVALGEGGRRLFVSNRGGRTVMVVDAATLICEHSRLMTLAGGLATVVVLRKCCRVDDPQDPCLPVGTRVAADGAEALGS